VRVITLLTLIVAFHGARADEKSPVPYKQVQPIFAKHCLSCHDAKEAEGKLVMETYALLMKGGEDGPAIVPGKADESPLIQQVEHKEKPFMPPPKKGDKLSADEIALLRRWIDGGAQGPAAGDEVAIARALPKVDPKAAPRRAINAMAYDAKSKLLALAVLNEIELRTPENQATIAKLGPHTGHVNALAFTADGAKLIAASGAPGVAGEITIWNVADGKQLSRFTGHKDAIYAVAISADGKTLATGSYDQRIILWNAVDGAALRTLEGHNGAVFDVAFRPDGKVLASASADRTVKLWDVASGKRLDTRSEPTKEQQTLAFSPDGGKLYAAGADNRVRVWRISPQAIEGSNSLLLSQFVAEGTVLRLAITLDGKTLATAADDKTVKLWDAEKLELKVALEPQSDWPAAVAFTLDSKVLSVGRLDGTVSYYDSATGKPVATPKPELTNIEPRGVQRGHGVMVKLTGKDILTTTSLKITGTDKLTAKIVTGERGTANVAWAQIDAAADAPLGAFDIVATAPGGASAAAKFIVDDLPQIEEVEKTAKSKSAEVPHATTLPVTFGGRFGSPGDVDAFAFEGKAGQQIVIDVAARRFGSKADTVVTLLDPSGRPLGTSADDYADADPLLVRTLPTDGRYVIRVNDLLGATSPQHYYRMSVGPFPYVTACFPLAVSPDGERDVRLIGYNLPDGASVKVKAPASGEVALPLDRASYRTRRAISVMVGGPAETTEVEPNDAPAQATKITLGSGVSGRFDEKPGTGDVDLYRFGAKAGQSIVVETQAAQRASAADTRVEVLWPDGRPVERVQLQAVRDSWITFRPIDANVVGARLNNWEEIELNQYLYLQGEVVKLHLYPRGPDSEFNFYAIAGRRRTYFDTSPTAHALEEKCYIVQPHKPGETLPANGLPVFKLNYVNDDDALRQLGADSRLIFTAPADGSYLVRVTDTRGFGGPRFTYRLLLRDAHPDFVASVEGLNPNVPPGSGRNFVVRVNRIDGFDGAVKVDLAGVAAPFTVSTPVVVEPGHVEAQGTIFATANPGPPTTQPIQSAPIKVTASATVNGKLVTKPLPDLPKLTISGQPLLIVSLTPIDPKQSAISVQPGQRVPAMLRVKRGTYKGLVSFEVENLPHGVLVSDIGLSGVLIPDGQDERQIFIQCAPWVASQTRPCHARALQGDNPTSPPVMLNVTERVVGQAN
jgi:hypothetical protein